MTGAAPFYQTIMVPAARWAGAAAGLPRSGASDGFLLAVAGQEALWKHRAQVSTGLDVGPARSFWQFERAGGVAGVLGHASSRVKALALCDAALVAPTPAAVWRALEGHDALAYGFARLLAWTDPSAIPVDEEPAFGFYLRTWRPGAWTNGTPAGRRALRAKWHDRWIEAQVALIA